MTNFPLNILVTRPAHQNLALCTLIEATGHRPLTLPTLEIEPADKAAIAKFNQQLTQQPTPNWLIFVSANAVELSWPLLKPFPDLLQQARIAAVGNATATALKNRGLTVDALPTKEFSSEGLLALPTFQQPLTGRILIVRGQGGRPYLGEQLTLRGAHVDYAQCYTRRIPKSGAKQITNLLLAKQIDLVTITSRAALQNLFKLCPTEHHHLLKRLSYALLSGSICQTVQELEISGNIHVANQATDQGLCDAIQYQQTATD